MPSRSFQLLTLAVCLAVAAGCSTQNGTGGREAVAANASVSSNEVERAIRASYAEWKGTPHRLGGTSRRGIDCSGLVQAVYRDEFAISLPRTTRALADVGRPVKKSALRAGDLVFFKPDTYPRHVGIYLAGNQFLHVSAKRGVMLSRTDSPYWTRHYWAARRVLR
jgi:cell wall-associated NlpC family hydrolase